MRSLIFIFLISLPFIACEHSKDKRKVGVLLHKGEGTSWIRDFTSFEKIAVNKGIDCIVLNAKNNEDLQTQQSENLINNEKVDVLIITAQNPNNADYIVREAHRNGIKVIAYRRIIKHSSIDYFVGFNSVIAGTLQVKYLLDKFPKKANIIILEGDQNDENARIIEKQHNKLLADKIDKGDYRIVYKTFIENWSSEEAFHQFKIAYNLSMMKVDAVLCANDAIATGVANYLNQNEIADSIFFTGMDAHKVACQRIIDGKQGMTVYKPIDKLVELALDLSQNNVIDKTVDLKYIDGVKSFLIVPDLITRKNINKLNHILNE